MKKYVSVASIMTKDLIKLKLTDDLTMAEALFKKHKIRHIPIVEGDAILGILSYTDLLRISYVDVVDENAQDVPVTVYNVFSIKQVMTKRLVTISPETTVKEAAEIIAQNEFHSLPVCENGIRVGLVTTTDLLKFLIYSIESL
jgi:CBS domain-containing protein